MTYVPEGSFIQGQTLLESVENLYCAFAHTLEVMHHNATCTCQACATMTKLDLKLFVHYGEYVIQDIRGKAESSGPERPSWLAGIPTSMPRESSDVEFLRRFGEHLRRCRVARNLTQEEIAAKAGFSRSYYTEIETGRRNPSLLNLKKLADCLEISLSELLDIG